MRKEPEVEAHFCFFILLSTRPCGPLFHPLPLRLVLWLYFEDKSDGRGYVLTGTGVTEEASYCRLSQNEHRIEGIYLITAVLV